MPVALKVLSAAPKLVQQQKSSRDLLAELRREAPDALQRASAFGVVATAPWSAAEAQLVVAREHGFANWERFTAYIEQVTTPGPTEPFVADPGFYEGRAAGLLEMLRGRLPNALAQLRTWHPDLASRTDSEIAALPLTIDDARLVYARQHGEADWASLMTRVATLPGGEPFAMAFAAMERRDAAELKSLLDAHPALVTAHGTNGNTLLNLAVSIEQDDGPLVRILLEAGADPGMPNDRGWTPLHQSVRAPLALVERLLAHGAVVTLSAHGDGGTPLALALWGGRTDIAKRLADVAVVPDNLRVNAALNDVAAVESFFDDSGALLARAATGRGFYRPHSGFPAWTPSTSRQQILDEALGWAARNNAIDAMTALVARGAAVDGVAYRGSPLMVAVYVRRHDAVRWLLNHGANPNLLVKFHGDDVGGTTALHLAAQTDDPQLVQLLLDFGADRTIRDRTYNADAAGWAEYVGAKKAAEMLKRSSPGS